MCLAFTPGRGRARKVNKNSEPVATGVAPSEPVKASVHSDLQYVSIQLEGSTYGGWYRLLPDGRMELLALANMHCERRSESTPIEQAQGMLTDFVRMRRKAQPGAAATLGALLYADSTKARVAEQDWVGLVRAVAAGDAMALRELYERAHRVVFTLLVRLTHDRSLAEQLTLDVFHDVWRRAASYDADSVSVLGWIMNHARSRAIDHWGLGGVANRAVAGCAEASFESIEVLHPSPALWGRLAERLTLNDSAFTDSSWMEPNWEDVAPGISCKLMATDNARDRVTMLVRLAPGTEYPPHTHAGVEELHLLQGQLHIDDRKLVPGDYNRAEPGSADKRVWSETGCMCVLMTSTRDVIA